MFIVYITNGSYDDYRVIHVMTGPESPQPIVDAVVTKYSDGRWTTQKQMDQDTKTLKAVREPLQTFVRSKIIAALEEAGFTKVTATEVWIGGY